MYEVQPWDIETHYWADQVPESPLVTRIKTRQPGHQAALRGKIADFFSGLRQHQRGQVMHKPRGQ